MKILEFYHVERLGKPFTLVMAESVANDVAVYEMPGRCDPEDVARNGTKWTERDARLAQFKWPADKHYRR